MAVKISRGKTLPIGLDLGTSAAKIAQLRTCDDDIELMAAGTAPVPPELRGDLHRRLNYLGGQIRSVLHSAPFKGPQCVLGLPAEATFVHHVRIPKVPPNETADAVAAELEGKLPYPVASAVVRHVVAGDVYGEGEPRQEVITVSAPRQTVHEYLAMARKAKLDVIGVNIESCALVECFARLFRRRDDSARTVLFVDIGSQSTQVVLCQGQRIAFARNLGIGGEKFDQHVAETAGIAVHEANALRRSFQAEDKNAAEQDEFYRALGTPIAELAEEITQCLRYYESVFRNQAIERVIFLGGQARDKRLCQEIARRLNMPAQVGDPLVRIKRVGGGLPGSGPDLREPQPDWAVAVGLSLGAA